MKMKKKAAFALALIMALLLATTAALAGNLDDGVSADEIEGEPIDVTGTDNETEGDIGLPIFEKGIVLKIETTDANSAWEFESTEDTNKRTFKLITTDDGKFRLSYQGTGADYGDPVDVYLEVSDTQSAESIRIEYMDGNGEKAYRDVTLDDDNLKVTPVRFAGTTAIKDVLIPRKYLVEEQSGNDLESGDAGADASATSDNAGDGIADNEDNKIDDEKDDDDMIIIEISPDDLEDYVEAGEATLRLKYNRRNGWQEDGIAAEEPSGDSNMIKIAWAALIAVSLVALFVNVMLIIAKNNKGGRR